MLANHNRFRFIVIIRWCSLWGGDRRNQQAIECQEEQVEQEGGKERGGGINERVEWMSRR